MSQALIEELQYGANLCTHFILPLLKLSKTSFHSPGFLNCYLTVDRTRVYVLIVQHVFLSRKILAHKQYAGTYRCPDGYFVVFKVPGRWASDVNLFCEGRFSKMSRKAREYIIRYSGLDYRKKEGKRVVTDGRLLALERPEIVKEMWGRELFNAGSHKGIDDPGIIPDEVLSKPGNETFIDPSGLTRIREGAPL